MSEVLTQTVFARVPTELSTPPGSPATGDTYKVGASPTGAWSGFTPGTYARYNGSTWDNPTLWRIDLDFTPKFVQATYGKVTALDTLTADASIGVGFSEGTNQGCGHAVAQDAQATTVTRKAQTNAALCLALTPGTTTTELDIDAVTGSAGPVTDGWDFSVDTPSGNEYWVEFLFIGGADFSAAVRHINNATSFTVSGLSFQPNMMLATAVANASMPTSTTGGTIGYGVCYDNGAGTTYAAFGAQMQTGQAAANTATRLQNDVGWFSCASDGASGTSPLTVTTWNSDGISAGTGSTIDLIIALLDTGDRAVYAGIVTTKTSTGSQSYTGPGWMPQCVVGAATGETTTPNAGGAVAENSMFGFFANCASVSVVDQDGADPSNGNTYASDDTITVYNDSAGAKLYEITSQSFTSSGWDWNFGTADGTARHVLAWAIQANADGDISAALTAGATATGTLTGTGALAANPTAGATASGALSGIVDLAANPTAGATLSAEVTGTGELVASLGAGATLSATPEATGDLAASLAAGATATGALEGSGALAAGLSAGATVSAAIAALGELLAALSASATVAGQLQGDGALSASLSASATAAGLLEGSGALSAGLSAGATASAVHDALGELLAALQAGATASGQFYSDGDMTAALQAGATLSALIAGDGALEASASAGAELSATIQALGALTAGLGATANAAGFLYGYAQVAASLSGGATLLGTLVNGGGIVFTRAPAERLATVRPSYRVAEVEDDDRTVRVGASQRRIEA